MNPSKFDCNNRCICVHDLMKQCDPTHYGPEQCDMIFKVLTSILLLIALNGFLLNSTIIFNFCRRPRVRKKIPNILLFSQAIADLANCLFYALSFATHLITQMAYKEVISEVYWTFTTLFILTAASSVLMFTTIAFERYLAISKPLWHHHCVTKSHIWRIIVIVWMISITFGLSDFLLTWFLPCEQSDIWSKSLQGLVGVLVLLVGIVFLLSFIKAQKSVRRRYSSSDLTQMRRSRRQLKLLSIFFSMYGVFLIGFIPITLIDLESQLHSPINIIKAIVFTTTSLLNPTMTLCLIKDLKMGRSRSRARAGTTSSTSSIHSRTASITSSLHSTTVSATTIEMRTHERCRDNVVISNSTQVP